MLFLQHLKAIITKENYDLEDPDLNFYTFFPQLRMFFVPMGIFFRNENSPMRFLVPAICLGLTFMATGMEMMFVLHGIQIKDYSFATECFCYCVMLGIIPVFYATNLHKKKYLLQILEDMAEDFVFICKLDTKLSSLRRPPLCRTELQDWRLPSWDPSVVGTAKCAVPASQGSPRAGSWDGRSQGALSSSPTRSSSAGGSGQGIILLLPLGCLLLRDDVLAKGGSRLPAKHGLYHAPQREGSASQRRDQFATLMSPGRALQQGVLSRIVRGVAVVALRRFLPTSNTVQVVTEAPCPVSTCTMRNALPPRRRPTHSSNSDSEPAFSK
ncbi:hypothetical protein evm_011521 [Chilo suppressalis]|nr:hypothetical protein evm_011521 [Chilo suppressalis]